MFEIKAKRYSGRIIIDEFNEEFKMAKGYWTTKDYKNNWKNELIKLLNKETSTCCLITWMNNPKTIGNYRGWVLYRRQNEIIIIERLWPANVLKPKFRKDETIIIQNRIPKKCSKWRTKISGIKIED